MRDVSKIPELAPSMEPAKTTIDPGHTFFVQENNARRVHYDFRLERNGVLVLRRCRKTSRYHIGEPSGGTH